LRHSELSEQRGGRTIQIASVIPCPGGAMNLWTRDHQERNIFKQASWTLVLNQAILL